jgi:phosphoglycolate phosphatase
MSFRALLLDFDGTLAATQPAVIASAQRVLDVLRRPPAADDAVRRVLALGLPLEKTFAAIDPALTPPQLADAAARYREIYAEIGMAHTALFPGVYETLQALHRRGAFLAVLSNKGRAAIERQMQTTGLTDFVDLIFAAEPDMPNKPDKAAFETRVAPAFPGVGRDAFLMVGDTAVDIQFAKNTGLASCWTAYGYGDPAGCRALLPDFAIARFDELLALPGVGP